MKKLLLLVVLLVSALSAGAQGRTPPVFIQEEDGSPRKLVGTLKLPNGTVTENPDGSVSYSGSVGGTAAGGSNTQLQYNSGGTLAGSAGFTVSGATNFATDGGRFNELRVKGLGTYLHRTNDTFGAYVGLLNGSIATDGTTNDFGVRFDIGDLLFVNDSGTTLARLARATGSWTNLGSIFAPTFEVGHPTASTLSASGGVLSVEGAALGRLSQNETIAGNWVNTANPWADNEVADALTLGSGSAVTGSLTFSDGVKQTFNPNGTNPGLNVGAYAGDPSDPENGDLWYSSVDAALYAWINGARVGLAAGSGDVTAAASFGTDNRLIRSDGTGKGVQASVVTLGDSGAITGVESITVTNFLAAGSGTTGGFDLGGLNIITNAAGTVTLKEIDAIDATSEATLKAAVVPDEAYGAGWNGDDDAPQKDDVYDQIEAEPSATRTFTGKTYDASATGNVLRFTDYRDFVYPGRVDGTGATITTNSPTSAILGLATHADTGTTNSNYAIYRMGIVPRDLDSATAMVLQDFGFTVSGTQTAAVNFSIAYWQPASTTAHNPTDFTSFSGHTTFNSGTLTTPAAGDVFYITGTTLTGWASGLTPGRVWYLAVARDSTDSNTDSVTPLAGTVEYTRTK